MWYIRCKECFNLFTKRPESIFCSRQCSEEYKRRLSIQKFDCKDGVCTLYLKDKNIVFDEENLDEVSKYCWRIDSLGYSSTYAAKKTIRMHVFFLGVKKGLEIDHINRNKLDNTKNNLRFVSHQKNTMNGSQKVGKLGYRGVSYLHNGSIRAFIKVKDKQLSLGVFKTPEEAALAYNVAAIKYRGEFAILNHVDLPFS